MATAALPVQGDDPSLYIDFNACASFGGGSNADYSEFTAISVVNTDCTQLKLVGGHVYRENPENNKHSCAPGRNNTSAMCISAMSECIYNPSSDLELKFDIEVIPGVDGTGLIEEVNFYSRSPEQFQFLEGPTGDNNYPTLYTFRVLVEGNEIYRAEDMPLNNNWRLQRYDFSSVPGFTVTDTTIFNFEILPYCLAGIPSSIQAWDIEDLNILGSCGIVDGGVISTTDETRVCNKGGQPMIIDFDVTGEEGDSSQWIVASGNGMILNIFDNGTIDFSNYNVGLFTVYHLSYSNTLTGLSEGEFLSGLAGCFELSNPIGINNLIVSGGEFLTEGLQNSISFCSGDGSPDIITTVLNGHRGSNTSYVVTDADSIVINIDDDPNFDFEGASGGICLYFALAHEKNNPGLSPGDHLNTLDDCFELSTPITVSRSRVDGGIIDSGGATTLTVCTGADISIEVSLSGAEGVQEAWVITDLAGEVLQLPASPPFDLNGVSAEACQIWHISYNGISNLGLGQNISALSGCFDLSNPILVSKETVSGGMLNIAGGGDEVTICADDGVSDAFNIMLMNAIGDSSQWLVTDTAGIILAFPTNPPFDFEGSGAGICELYRLSHNGGLMGLMIGEEIDAVTGCFALSNAITITRLTGTDCPDDCVVDGGFIDLFNNSLCVGDGVPDLMDADVLNAVGDFSNFILTDSDSLILMVLDSLPVDLDGLTGGTFLFWHLSSDTQLEVDSTLVHINDIDLPCYDLSAPASFTTTFNNAGMVSLLDGSTSMAICLTDSISDILEFNSSSLSNNSYQFVVTDTFNVILGLPDSTVVDFSGAGPGVCWVWGVSYTGNFLPTLGDTLGNAPATGFCFDISDNAVEIVRDTLGGACAMEACLVEGGTIDLFDNSVCVGDGVPDPIDGDVIGATGDYQTFVITDSDSLVLLVQDNLPVDLDGSGGGVCLFWHLSANDTLVISQGMHINNIIGCHDLSNPAAVSRTENNAGMVSLLNGTDSITICVSDTLSDVLEFINNSVSGNNYQYVLTDTSNLILNLPDSTLIDFTAAPTGICYVYGVSYTGAFVPVVGDTLGNESITNECFDISDNFVEVIRVEGSDCPDDCAVDAGTLELITNSACVGDGLADLIDGQVSGEVGDYFVFLITGTDSLILGIANDLPLNFESAGPGACLIWHLASNDSIPINMGSNVTSISGCFDLAEPQQVTRTENNAGLVSLEGGGSSITVCVGDGASDELIFDNSSNSGNSYQYVITDNNNIILALPGGNSFDFENSATGTCLVWGVSYTGSFDLMIGDSLDIVPSAGGCFDISGNFVEVIRVDSGPECVTGPASTIVLNRVGNSGQIIDIKNISSDTINVADYWICELGNYNQIRNIVIECGGDTIMAPGDIIGLNINVDDADGELGIYTMNQFTNPAAIIDYVEWGSSGHLRSSVAVAAGIWTTGDFVSAITPTMSIYYDDDGDSSSDWSESATNFCFDSSPIAGGEDIEFRIFPNPAVDNVAIDIISIPENVAEILVFDSFGSTVSKMTYENIGEDPIDIILPDLVAGTYFIRIKTKTRVNTKKFLITH